MSCARSAVRVQVVSCAAGIGAVADGLGALVQPREDQRSDEAEHNSRQGCYVRQLGKEPPIVRDDGDDAAECGTECPVPALASAPLERLEVLVAETVVGLGATRDRVCRVGQSAVHAGYPQVGEGHEGHENAGDEHKAP